MNLNFPSLYKKLDYNDAITSAIDGISKICEGQGNLMISIFDINKYQFRYCNDSFKNVLGYTDTEILKIGWKFWFQNIHPSEMKEIRKRINNFINTTENKVYSQSDFFSYHIKTALGEWKLLHHRLFSFSYKKELFVLSYLQDISQIEQIDNLLGIDSKDAADFKEIDISSREKEVLRLVADGFSSKEISDQLFISSHTVTSHRKNLIEKFKVSNTAQLIKEASKMISL
tara:strand:- start:1469 stop:2155 length:687 start_codon:yes stop_codon:yes gene_type:complete